MYALGVTEKSERRQRRTFINKLKIFIVHFYIRRQSEKKKNRTSSFYEKRIDTAEHYTTHAKHFLNQWKSITPSKLRMGLNFLTI